MDDTFTPEEVIKNNDALGRIGTINSNQQNEQDGAPDRRTPYRRCHPTSYHFRSIPFRYWLAAASVAFLFLPGYGNLLYLRGTLFGTSVLGSSCTSGNEWLWIGITSVLLLIPHLNKSSCWMPGSTMSISIRPKLTLTQLNCIWYAAALIGPCLWKNPGAKSFVVWLGYFGGKAAWPALMNLTITLLPTQRLSYLLDFYYFDSSDDIATRTTMVSMHMNASWWMVIWLALHTILLTIEYLVLEYDTFWEKMLPLTKYTTEGIVNFSGWVGGFMLLILWTSARNTVRHRWYDTLFLQTHIISAIGFVLASNLHDYNTLMFAWPGLAEILIDRLMRWCSYQDPIAASNLEVHSDLNSVVRLTTDQPKSWSWTSLAPGRHVYLRDKSVNPQWHPVTISSVDHENRRISIHIKARGDWTDKFVANWINYDPDSDQKGDLRDSSSVNLKMEGLYGPDLSSIFEPSTTSFCVFVAGGIGVTGLSEAIQVCAQRGVPFTVIWIVHTRAEAEALGSDILWNTRLLRSVATTNAPAAFQVFVTAEKCLDPNAPDSNVDSFIHDDSKLSHCHHAVDHGVGSTQECATPIEAQLSALTVSVVVLLSMALSFIAARQMCCYHSDPSMDHAKTCNIAFDSSSCRYCSMDDIRHQDEALDELPCCTVDCYLCFRGLTVVSVLFLAPILASLVLYGLRRYWPTSEKDCCLILAHRMRQRHYHSAVQEIVTIKEENGSISWAHVNLTGQESDTLTLTNTPPMTSELVTVNYSRPDIHVVLQSLWSTREDESFEKCTMPVVVCGPQRLVDDVRQEMDRQQSQDFANQYKLIVM